MGVGGGIGGVCCDIPALAGGDHFVARFLVDNALRGAPAPNQAGYFRYIQDPGDGTGIGVALGEMLALGVACDLCIGEGVYTRAVGLARFVVPAGCRVWSPGGANIITNAADDCLFELGAGCSLERLTLTQRGVLGAAGVALVECPVGGAKVRLEELQMVTPVQVRGAQLVGGSYEVSSCSISFTGGGAAPVGISIEGAGGNPGKLDVHNTFFSLVNVPIRMGFTVNVTVLDSRIMSNRMNLAVGVVPIAAGASCSNSLAMGNVSRGSGATLPTDAGVGNSINPGIGNIWGA